MKHNADRLNRMQIREQQQLNRQRQAQIDAEQRNQTQAIQRTKQKYSHVSSYGYGSLNNSSMGMCSKNGRDGGRDTLPSVTQAPNKGATNRLERPVQHGGGSGATDAMEDDDVYAHCHANNHHHRQDNVHGVNDDDTEVRVYVRECDGDDARQIRYRESESEIYTTAPAPAECQSTRPNDNMKANKNCYARHNNSHHDDGSSNNNNDENNGIRSRANEGVPAARDQNAAVRDTASRPARTATGVSGELPGSHSRGTVPRYLQQRKAELHAEKQAITEHAQQLKELAKIPPGHRLVDDAEKAYTIEKLNERRAELELQLHKIPIRFDTESIKARRRNIEEELCEIEMTKKKYSGSRSLYLPID